MTSLLFETGLIAAIGGGIVFAEAGLAKFRHRALVPGVVANYRILPGWAVAPVAAWLPAVEVGLALALFASVLTGGAVRGAAGAAAALLVVFGAAMAINIVRGRRMIDCGCGRSQLRQPLGWGLVLRNGVLAALMTIHALTSPTRESVGVAELALALVAGSALFLMILLFNSLTALAASPLASGRR